MRQRMRSALIDQVEADVIEELCILGEEAVSVARNEHVNNWQDQTGNLRSSIGYMVFKDGVPVMQSTFEQITAQHPHDNDVYDGANRGMQFCKSIGEKTQGLVLVVVAGMKYASYVEKRGRDVLTSAEYHVENNLKSRLQSVLDDLKF